MSYKEAFFKVMRNFAKLTDIIENFNIILKEVRLSETVTERVTNWVMEEAFLLKKLGKIWKNLLIFLRTLKVLTHKFEVESVLLKVS